ncbi:MAG: hypothetical protein ACON42_09055 [Flavobacteriaceae bacterium]
MKTIICKFKTVAMLMAALLLSFSQISCSSDDDDAPPPVVVDDNDDDDDGNGGDGGNGGDNGCEFENVNPNINDGTVDFECSGNAFLAADELNETNTAGNWGRFGPGSGGDEYLTLNYVDNPYSGGINTSERVLAVTEQAGVENWAGFFFDLEEKVNFPAGQGALKIKVYSAEAGQNVLMKLEDKTDAQITTGDRTALTTTSGEWEEVIFNFSEDMSDMYDRIVFIMNLGATNDAEVTYFMDDIAFSEPVEVVVPDDPTTAAPDPTTDAANVISIFSDAYSNVEGTNFNPDWGQSTVVEEVSIDGNNTLKYSNLNYQGTEFASAIDVSGKTMLHIDYWTPNATNLNFYLISPGPAETSVALDVSTLGEWQSVDIPLSDYADVVNLSEVIQFKVVGTGNVFFDNIYFHGSSASPSAAAPVPTHPEAEVMSIFSDSYTDIDGTNFNPNWGQSGTVETEELSAGNSVMKYTNLNYQGTQFGAALDVTGKSHIHLDYWSADATVLRFFMISSGPAETAYDLPIQAGSWQSVDIPLSHFSGVVDLADVIQFKVDTGDGNVGAGATVYWDNIYFHGTSSGTTGGGSGGSSGGGSSASQPSTSAPTPSQADADVISIFSDAFTDVSGTNFSPDWGQSTVVSIEEYVTGDSVLKYSNLNYQGFEFASSIDVSGKTNLHIDYWVADTTAVNFYLISPGPAETAYALDVSTTGQWVSVDIPLSTFSAVNLADVFQMKLGEGNGTIFFDNIYFH